MMTSSKSNQAIHRSPIVARLSNYNRARSILGADFISPEDVAKSRRGVVYTADQLLGFGETLPSEVVQKWCRDNDYMLIAGPSRPMSLLEIRTLRSSYFYSREGGWYTKHQFAESDKTETCWIMLRKEPVPQSTSKNWNEQEALLSETELVPNVAEVAWCVTTYKAVRNTNLLLGVYVRTSSIDSDGYRVIVGDFAAKGLDVNDWRDAYRDGSLGVSAGRK